MTVQQIRKGVRGYGDWLDDVIWYLENDGTNDENYRIEIDFIYDSMGWCQ